MCCGRISMSRSLTPRSPPSPHANGVLGARESRCATRRARRAMLKQRVLTAVVLVAVLLGVMLGLPPVATVWLLTVLILIGAWEWAAFVGKGSPGARSAF